MASTVIAASDARTAFARASGFGNGLTRTGSSKPSTCQPADPGGRLGRPFDTQDHLGRAGPGRGEPKRLPPVAAPLPVVGTLTVR
ncbi:hypothetical protein ACL02O_15410 [Micromonospora sp. MS34]|uniref:hypothetical protein n=1 Tax=Micromonospora sp. MS34 TaxID=3385971 RepID=UPI0039A27360